MGQKSCNLCESILGKGKFRFVQIMIPGGKEGLQLEHKTMQVFLLYSICYTSVLRYFVYESIKLKLLCLLKFVAQVNNMADEPLVFDVFTQKINFEI